MTLRCAPFAPFILGLAVALPACNAGVFVADNDDDDATDDDDDDPIDPALEGWCQVASEDFSFFVTSMAALWALSGDDINDLTGGFGGNFGGLDGADEICAKIGAATGHSDRDWRAFLSAWDGGDGNPAHAIERVGDGPWTDANDRLVATGIDGLLADVRPDGEEQSTDDLPDECGIPLSSLGDAHDVVTGSRRNGRLFDMDPQSTCLDWTADSGAVGSTGGGPQGTRGVVRCGHSFPRQVGGGGDPERGQHWLSDHPLRGCDKGANLGQGGEGTCIGCSGGYGAIYCFAAD